MTTRDQDIALERLSLQHDGAALQVQLADTPGSIRATALDESGAVYELDPAGRVRLVRGNGARYTPRDDHEALSLFNAQACHFAARAIAAAKGGSGSTRDIRKRYAPRVAA